VRRTRAHSTKLKLADPEQGQRQQRATLRDVATAAEVSPMTVSNFINNKFGAMSPETRARIEQHIERLGYRPHTMARSLRLSERLTIGMIIVDDVPTYLADPFTTRLVAGLSNYLSERGYGLLLQGLHPKHFKTSPLIRDIRTDGICVFLSGNDPIRQECLEILLNLKQPVVAFQETLRFPGRDLCIVRQDDREGGRMITNEALAAGAKRLVMLVPKLYWPAMGERIKGGRAAIRESRSKAALRLIRCEENAFQEIQSALARDIEENGLPDAVLAGNDQIGIAATKLMAGRGLKVPRDVLVTGFNAFDFWQYSDPVLTTVRSPAYEMGARGGAAILNRLKTGSFAEPEIVFSVELLRGEST
jgi:LacI family transcriptional regulator, galactose operon repressor